MPLGDTTRSRKLRAEALESLVRGLPRPLLMRAVEILLDRLHGSSQDALARAIDNRRSFQKTETPIVEALLSVLKELPQEDQEIASSALLDLAAGEALGNDEP
jgi:hypothetical protein